MGVIRTSTQKFTVLGAATSVAALVVALLAAITSPTRPNLVLTAVFLTLFTASENLTLKFPTRVAVSPGVVLILAEVVALNHRGEVLGTLVFGVGGGLVVKAIRSHRWAAISFNAGQTALSAAGSALIYEALSQTSLPAPITYPLTVLAYMTGNALMVANGSSIRSGARRRAVLWDLRATLVNYFFFGLAGMLIGRLYLIAGAWTLLAVLAPVVVARTVFVSIVGFRQAYNRLEVLYSFTRHLELTREEPDAAALMLAELRTLVSVATAEIVVPTANGWRRTALSADDLVPSITHGLGSSPEMMGVAEGPRLVLDRIAGDLLSDDLAKRGLTPALVAPLRAEAQLIGAIVLAHPEDDRRLNSDDLKLLETLANHAAASLENSRLLDQLRYDSHHDRLTGLPNRQRFTELVASLPVPSAILLIDLDRFKDINDTLGHAHGDLLLQRVGERIETELGRRGIVARLGGDEFGVLLPRTRASDASQDAVALLEALEQPFDVEDLRLEVTASIGVAVATTADDDTDKLMQQADVAMYAAKASHSGWEMYSSERDHNSRRRLALAGELRHAISADELVVFYQPKASLQDSTVIGVEALVRWRHPQWGLLPPDTFIPVAEQAGLIRPLTLFVLSAAALQHQKMQAQGFDLDVAVNLSVRSVLDVNLPDQVAEVLAHHHMAASSLTLEVTETSVMADPARTIGVLGRLSSLGASISIDDFGTGYSSLSYLKRLPAAEVKIDRSFITGMAAGTADLAIVRSTVDLARNLGLKAVAEGVEDLRTWNSLIDMGCDQAQGYYLSRPLPTDELQTWLTARDGAAGVAVKPIRAIGPHHPFSPPVESSEG